MSERRTTLLTDDEVQAIPEHLRIFVNTHLADDNRTVSYRRAALWTAELQLQANFEGFIIEMNHRRLWAHPLWPEVLEQFAALPPGHELDDAAARRAFFELCDRIAPDAFPHDPSVARPVIYNAAMKDTALKRAELAEPSIDAQHVAASVDSPSL